MGITTMASPNGAQAPEFPQSLLHHTLDEFQSYISELGKPMYKVNIGELVNSVQPFPAPTSLSPSFSASIAPPVPSDCNVLRDIPGQEKHGNGNHHAMFREAMMENLLIQAGALNPAHEGRSQPLLAAEPGDQQQPKWMQYELDTGKQQQQQQSMGFLGSSLPLYGNTSMINAGFSERCNSSDSIMLTEVSRSEEIVDKSIERRQKRMIKNRESAARSRARKQAYINQLEERVKKLENTNTRLKRQMEEMLSRCDSSQGPRHQLRRTSSAPF